MKCKDRTLLLISTISSILIIATMISSVKTTDSDKFSFASMKDRLMLGRNIEKKNSPSSAESAQAAASSTEIKQPSLSLSESKLEINNVISQMSNLFKRNKKVDIPKRNLLLLKSFLNERIVASSMEELNRVLTNLTSNRARLAAAQKEPVDIGLFFTNFFSSIVNQLTQQLQIQISNILSNTIKNLILEIQTSIATGNPVNIDAVLNKFVQNLSDAFKQSVSQLISVTGQSSVVQLIDLGFDELQFVIQNAGNDIIFKDLAGLVSKLQYGIVQLVI
jgi:hypothetical protein